MIFRHRERLVHFNGFDHPTPSGRSIPALAAEAKIAGAGIFRLREGEAQERRPSRLPKRSSGRGRWLWKTKRLFLP
jgi:hypothetical protein